MFTLSQKAPYKSGVAFLAFVLATQTISSLPETKAYAPAGELATAFSDRNRAKEFLLRSVCDPDLVERNIGDAALVVASEKFKREINEKYPKQADPIMIKTYFNFIKIVTSVFLSGGPEDTLCSLVAQVAKGESTKEGDLLPEVHKSKRLEYFLNFLKESTLQLPDVASAYEPRLRDELKRSLENIYGKVEPKMRDKFARAVVEMALGNAVESYENFIYHADLMKDVGIDVNYVTSQWLYKHSQRQNNIPFLNDNTAPLR